MARVVIIIVASIFLVVTGAAAGAGEKKGVREKIQAVEDTTERANTEIGYVIGLTATTPIVFACCLVGRIILAPVQAAKDTYEAVTTVYRTLRKKEAGEEAGAGPGA